MGGGNYTTKNDVFDLIYPVGSIYLSVNSVDPSTIFGGTWEQIKDTFLLSSGDTYSIGSTGGNSSTTLEIANLPSHNHTGTTGNQSANHYGVYCLRDPPKTIIYRFLLTTPLKYVRQSRSLSLKASA